MTLIVTVFVATVLFCIFQGEMATKLFNKGIVWFIFRAGND